MSTIRDVAKVAGVSVSTVSRVINSTGYVSEDSLERVTQAMKALQYVPNALARGLVSKRTASIGLLIPDVSNPFFAEIARGLEDGARIHGYTVILCNSDWRIDREREYIRVLRSRKVDGVVIAGARTQEETLRTDLLDLPLVLVDRQTSGATDSIWSDNVNGARMATEHLMMSGCKRIAHISGPDNSPSAQDRLRGYLETMTRHPGYSPVVIEGNFRFEAGFQAFQQLVRRNELFVDGVFAGNDMMALGLIQAMQSSEFHAPEQIKVVGYDNISFASYVSPTLSTISQPGYEMGTMALEMVIDSIENPEHEIVKKQIFPELIIRHSSGLL